jgi:hypothetical protein
MEEILLSPAYKNARGFLESAFSLSDARIMGQVSDLASFNAWASAVVCEIAGREAAVENLFDMEGIPPVLDTALDAMLTGIKHRGKSE